MIILCYPEPRGKKRFIKIFVTPWAQDEPRVNTGAGRSGGGFPGRGPQDTVTLHFQQQTEDLEHPTWMGTRRRLREQDPISKP